MSDITSRLYSKEGEESWDRIFGKKRILNNTYIYRDSMNKKRCSCGYGNVLFDIVNMNYRCDHCGAKRVKS